MSLESSPLILGDFGLRLPLVPASHIDPENTTITVTVHMAIEHTDGPGSFTDGEVAIRLKFRDGSLVSGVLSDTVPLGASINDYELAGTLEEWGLDDENLTAEEIMDMEVELVGAITDPADDFEEDDEITVTVDACNVAVTLVGLPITYDDEPGDDELCIIPYTEPNSGTGTGTAGLHSEFISDPYDFLNSRFEIPEAAGTRQRAYLRCSGESELTRGVHIGCAASDYPANPCGPLQATPLDLFTASQLASGELDEIDAVLAMNCYYAIHAALPLQRRPIMYCGAPPARTTATALSFLDSFWQNVVDADAHLGVDMTGPLSYTNPMAAPYIADPVNEPNTVLLGWWEADAGMSVDGDGTAVPGFLSINDPEEEDLEWVQATVANQATIQTNELNGNQVLRFDGTNDFYTLAAPITLTGNWTVMVLVKPSAADQCVLSNAVSNRQLIRLNATGAGRITCFDGVNEVTSSSGQFTAGEWCLIVLICQGSELSIWVNGVEVSGYETSQTFDQSFDIDCLGCLYSAEKFLAGDLAYVHIIANALNDESNHKFLLESRINSKYGVYGVSGGPILPAANIWASYSGDSNFAGKMFTESAERIDLGDPTELGGWLSDATAANNAGGVIASTARHRAEYEEGNPGTYGRADLIFGNPEAWQTPESLDLIVNADGSKAQLVIHIDASGTFTNESVLAAIAHFAALGVRRFLVHCSALDEEGWTDVIDYQTNFNETGGSEPRQSFPWRGRSPTPKERTMF